MEIISIGFIVLGALMAIFPNWPWRGMKIAPRWYKVIFGCWFAFLGLVLLALSAFGLIQ